MRADMLSRRALLAGAAAFAGSRALAQGDHDHSEDALPGAVELLSANACLKFAALLRETGVEKEIDALPAWTLFVPADDHWADAPASAAPGAAGEARRRFARRHACAGAWTPQNESVVLTNLNGEPLRAGPASVNGAAYWLTDLRARHGRVHLLRGFPA